MKCASPSMLRQPQIILLLAFNAAYLLAATVAAMKGGNREFVFYLGVMLLLGLAVIVVHLRVNLSLGVLWGLSLWGFAHMAGGLVPAPESWPINGNIRVLYSLWIVPGLLKYDHLVHAFGFAVTTCLCWEGLRRMIADQSGRAATEVRPTTGMMILSGAAGMGFGALNEVVEFIATLTVPETNVGGYANTGWDLVSNLTGCVLAAAAIRWCTPRLGPGGR